VLSEIPQEWSTRLATWQRLNRKHHAVVDGAPVPGANTAYFIYQTLVGAWPIDRQRLGDYVLKAVREAKVHTSWTNPNARYEDALTKFVEVILDPERSAAFLEDFVFFQARVARFGALNSIGQVLVKITAPGVPDFYQGGELWDLSLVDPDNRRPVDWDGRRRLLDELLTAMATAPDRAALAHELVKSAPDGRVKLFVIHEGLAVRRAHRALFEAGAYRPLDAHGAWAEHVCAFARVGGDTAAITVVPRLLARRGVEALPLGPEYWADTWLSLPPEMAGAFSNALTGETVQTAAGGEGVALRLGDVLTSFPAALLVRGGV
jgi:maltooligosyltrehalose synthase